MNTAHRSPRRQPAVAARGPLWVLALALALLCGGGAHAELMQLSQAQARITVQGRTTYEQITLPYNWDIRNQAQPGTGTFTLLFDISTPTLEPWGVYLPSVGNAYAVWLNGTLLQHEGDLLQANGADFSKLPRFLLVSPSLLQPHNVLQINIRADAERRGGLSTVLIGPQPQAYAAYQRSYLWRGHGSLLVVASSLLVGCLALGLWLTQVDHFHPAGPRRAPLYLFAAMAEFCWTLAVGDALIENPVLAWPWWSAVPAAGAAAWACAMQLFCIEVAQWRAQPLVRWLRRWLLLLIALSAVLPLSAAAWQQPLALTAWHVAMAVTFLGFGYVFLRQALGTRNGAHRLVAAALCINLVVGIWDLCNFRIFPDFPDNSLLRFSSLFFGLALAVIVITRFSRANHEARSLLATLSTRIAQKEADLHASYRKLESQAREHERTAERGRILRDMHDGVGSHITLAIRQLQADAQTHHAANPGEVLHTLRDALDHLKLTIDALNLPPGDITALLASLRYRLEPRLAASGVTLVWDVALLRVENHLDAHTMGHLQFMLYEAFSNALQHAQATVLRIEAHACTSAADPQHAGVAIRVIDDGKGFDVDATQRKGLASMHARASAIGAQLEIRSQPGQTVVQIELGCTVGD